jgi:hypothetical protein
MNLTADQLILRPFWQYTKLHWADEPEYQQSEFCDYVFTSDLIGRIGVMSDRRFEAIKENELKDLDFDMESVKNRLAGNIYAYHSELPVEKIGHNVFVIQKAIVSNIIFSQKTMNNINKLFRRPVIAVPHVDMIYIADASLGNLSAMILKSNYAFANASEDQKVCRRHFHFLRTDNGTGYFTVRPKIEGTPEDESECFQPF